MKIKTLSIMALVIICLIMVSGCTIAKDLKGHVRQVCESVDPYVTAGQEIILAVCHTTAAEENLKEQCEIYRVNHEKIVPVINKACGIAGYDIDLPVNDAEQ